MVVLIEGEWRHDDVIRDGNHHLEAAAFTIAVVTLQDFVLGKLDLLTVSLGKLKFASVTDFSLITSGKFYRLGLENCKRTKESPVDLP